MNITENKGVQKIGSNEKKLCKNNVEQNSLFQKISDALDLTPLQNINEKKTAMPILLAIMSIESRCDPNVGNSGAGAKGLMQLTKIACKQINVSYDSMNDINENIKAGILLINYLINTFRSKKTDKKTNEKYISSDFNGRIAWIMLAYNNGFRGAINYAQTDKKIADTFYYNDFNVFHTFWKADADLKKFISNLSNTKNIKSNKNTETNNKKQNKSNADREAEYDKLIGIESLYEFNNRKITKSLLTRMILNKLLN